MAMQPTSRRRSAYDNSWRHTKDMPSGRFGLYAYSPYRSTVWKRTWCEKACGEFPSLLKRIRPELERGAAEISALVAEARRVAELQYQRQQEQWREYEKRARVERRIKAEEESQAQLLEIVDAWGLACRIEGFFADAERHCDHLEPDERSRVLERLERARQMLRGTDALHHFDAWRTPEQRVKSGDLD